MAKVTFDGEALLIITEPGVLTVDIGPDVYSEWKIWKAIDDNSKYFTAFRTSGGDPLTPGINAGVYFFLQNQSGWRWKPAEEDATVLVTGNLAPEDSTVPILTPTFGDYTVLYQGLQPITQSVEDLLTAQEDAAYNGEIVFDSLAGLPGTEYPIGLLSNPVNNVDDVFKISAKRGIKKVLILNGEFILDRDAIGFNLHGGGSGASLTLGSHDISGAIIWEVLIKNTPDLINSSKVRFSNCTIIDGISNFLGRMDQVGLHGEVSFKTGAALLSFCFNVGTITGDGTIFNLQGNASHIDLRSWSGELTLSGISSPQGVFHLDSSSAFIRMDNTNTEGNISLRGVGEIEDNSSGTIIDRDGFIQGSDLIQLREYIYVDIINGVPGTTENIGISTNPVDNMEDAFILASRRGTKNFQITGSIILEQDFEGYLFRGDKAHVNSSIDFNGHSVDGSEFLNLVIGGNGTGHVIGNNCEILTMSGISGEFILCGLKGDILLPGNSILTSFVNCYSEIPGQGSPSIDMGVGIVNLLQMRAYSGGVRVYNCDMPQESISIDLVSGHPTLDSTCTAGDIVIRGAGWLTDNSNGSTVTTKGLLGEMEIAIERILGLSQHNYRITDQVYDDKLMLSSTVRIYATKADADADTNHTFEYVMNAAYDGVGRLTDYKMTTAT